jgi:hypothetical protein
MGQAFAVTAAVAFLAAAAKGRASLGGPVAADRKILISYFALLGMSLAFSAAESARLTPDVYLVIVINQLLIAAVLVCQLTLLILWSRPLEWRRLILLCVTSSGVITIAMVILASLGAYARYTILYFALFTIANITLLAYCLSCSTWVRSAELRVCLLVAACGAVCLLCYACYAWLRLSQGRVGWPAIEPGQTRLWWAVAGVALNLVGWTIPDGCTRLGRWREWLATFRAFRRLRPLWEALVRAAPGVLLDETMMTHSDLFAIGDLDFWLHRRLVEIRDAWLLMRQYFDVQTSDRAASMARASELTGIKAVAMVEAAQLARAISVVRVVGPRSRDARGTLAMTFASTPCKARVDELTWLTEVAAAFSVLYRRKAL